jgi:S-adenosylmethionine:tRNA ribosyltransferase-isomerase
VNAASWPREDPLLERLLVVDPAEGAYCDASVRDLPAKLRPGDLLVVNDAATLPASLLGRTALGLKLEVRLAARHGTRWTSVLFGAGDWRTKTEDRPPPPPLSAGDRLVFDAQSRERTNEPSATLWARVAHVHSARLLDLEFEADEASFLTRLYRLGRPVQYAYVKDALPLWAVQTRYASRPWAMEMPSAGRPLTWSLLSELDARGIAIARLTHAAGLSSTGDPELDAKLPLPEQADIPASTVVAIRAAQAGGGRVIAVGTSVVRALEGRVARRGELTPGEEETDLIIGPGFRRRVVDGLFTGMHEPTASHYLLLGAFAPAPLLRAAYEHAARAGYQHHEFGDSNLIVDGSV